MIGRFLYISLIALFLINYPIDICYSQNSGRTSSNFNTKKNLVIGYAMPKWTVNDPFEQNVFIENNEGQFDGKNGSDGGKILFSSRITGIDVYFSCTGITYRYNKFPEVNEDGTEIYAENDTNNKKAPAESQFYFVKWIGANSNAELKAEEEVSFYYTYPQGNKHTTVAHAFKKILYQNIYPSIDIEYSFPEEKKALEYTIIVHPGADLSQVKMVYNNAENIKKNAEGNIETEGPLGKFIDYAPYRTYYKESNNVIASSFQLKGNAITFIADYDHTKTLIIDPWTVTPIFSNYSAGYDICYDFRGNVYAYGSFSPYQEIKVNSNGVIKWIYTIPNSDPQYGDFAVDEATGISYDGSCTYPYIYKVDTSGLQTNSYWVNSTMEELWRMAFNKCENQIILAGGGVGLNNQACTLDTGLTTLNAVNVLSSGAGHHDMSLLAIDNDNSSVFMAVAATIYNGLYPNEVMRCPLPSLTPTNYLVRDGYSFKEGKPITNYIDGVSGHTLAMNGAVASPNWLYLYDGATLKRINKTTGAIVLTKSICNSSSDFSWGGIDVDLCDNLYLGDADTVKVYDSSLNNIGNIIAPNHIYDLHIAPNNLLVATGLKFISSFTITTNPVSVSFSSVSPACLGPTGKATATLKGCGNDSSTYNYLWSNGVTTQTDTGLAPGTYTVTISSGCDFVYSDTITITSASNNWLTLTGKSPICPGKADTIIANGGTAYLWSNGATTSSITISPAITTTYSLQVSNGGCKGDTNITITVAPSFTPVISGKDSICSGTTDILSATGGGTYLWSTGSTASSIIVSPSIKTLYTIEVTNGCPEDTSFTVNILPTPVISISASDTTICSGTTAQLIANGAASYQWFPPVGLSCSNCSSPTASPSANTTYTVIGTNSDGCSSTSSINLQVDFAASITISSAQTICSGTAVNLFAFAVGGGGTFTWEPSNSSTSELTVYPSTTTAYTVQYSNACGTSIDTVTVFVNPSPVPSFNSDITAGCAPLCIQFRDESTISSGNIIQWSWVFGDGDTSYHENPIYCYPDTGTYTVTHTAVSENGCSATLQIVRMIQVFSKPIANFIYSPQPINILQPTIQFTDKSTDIYGITYWTWNFGDGEERNIQNSFENPVHIYQDTGTYCPQLVVVNNKGCVDTVTNCLEVDPIFTLYIPSAFSPNGDRLNDVFAPKGVYVKSFEMYIFDRWGMELYHTTDINKGWDGTVKGSSNIAQEDSYVYKITATDWRDTQHSYVGEVTLIK